MLRELRKGGCPTLSLWSLTGYTSTRERVASAYELRTSVKPPLIANGP
jgi:hypothetical protein